MNRLTEFLTISSLLGASAVAQDARELIAVKAAKIRTNTPVSDISIQLTKAYRAIDIEVRSVSPLRVDTTYVLNSGAYQINWSWAYDKTATEIQGMIHPGRRLLKLTPYVVNGQTKYCAIFVDNTGANKKDWFWWHSSTFSHVKTQAAILGARLIDLESHISGGVRYYSGIGIKNTGSDYRTWKTISGITPADLDSELDATGHRVYDLEVRTPGRLDVVLIKAPQPTYSWRVTGPAVVHIETQAAQNGARIFDLERYVVNGQTYHTALLIQNTNELTTRVGAALRAETDGVRGFLLKEVGGYRWASLLRDFRYEPGMTIGQVHGAYAYRNVVTNPNVYTVSMIPYRDGPCPYTTGNLHEMKLRDAVWQTMEALNPRSAVAIETFFGGRLALEAFMDSVGMADSSINRTLGCSASPKNRMALEDLESLQISIRNGLLGAFRDDYRNRLVNSVSKFPGLGDRNLANLLTEERLLAGLTIGESMLFTSRLRLAYNAGKEVSGGKYYRSTAGWVEIPFVVNNAIELRQYTLAAFAHGASNGVKAENAVSKAVHELLRSRIRAAMATFKGFQLGSYTQFGASCKPGVLTPVHEGNGQPELNQIAHLDLRSAPSNRLALMWVGMSSAQWGATPLPISLGIIGAPGCSLFVSPDVSFVGTTDTQGKVSHQFTVNAPKSAIGLTVYSQFAILAPGTNAAGFVTTNGLATTIGGTK